MRYVRAALIIFSLMALACGPLTYLSGEFDDGIEPEIDEEIEVGDTVNAGTSDIFEVHEFRFEAEAGQEIVVRAQAIGETDPRLRLLDSEGFVYLENDDTSDGSRSAEVTFIVPSAGVYTAQVDFFHVGDYTLSVIDISPTPTPTATESGAIFDTEATLDPNVPTATFTPVP